MLHPVSANRENSELIILNAANSVSGPIGTFKLLYMDTSYGRKSYNKSNVLKSLYKKDGVIQEERLPPKLISGVEYPINPDCY